MLARNQTVFSRHEILNKLGLSEALDHLHAQHGENLVFVLKELIRTIMNKAAIIEIVHEKMGGTKVSAEQTVDGILEAMVKTLKSGGEVSIAGLGIFSVKPRAARTARNPKTGEAIQVPATRVPKFRAAKALKDAVK